MIWWGGLVSRLSYVWTGAWLLFFLTAMRVDAQELATIPPLQGWVTDLTGTLDTRHKGMLADKLQLFEIRKGAQIRVLLVPSTRPESIEQYAIRVFDKWKLGREGIDDGVLLVAAKKDRTMRIEVGYGLEGVLSDATTNRILDEKISPFFLMGDYLGGLERGIDGIFSVIEGEPLPPQKAKNEEPVHPFELVTMIGQIFCAVGVGVYFREILRRFFHRRWVRRLLGSLCVAVLGATSLLAGNGQIFTLLIVGLYVAAALLLPVDLISRLEPFLALGGTSRNDSKNGDGGGNGTGSSGGGGSAGGGGASGRW